MLRFLLRRLIVAVAVALTVSVITFTLSHVAVDPALAVAPDMDDDGTPDVAVEACDETVEGLVQAGRVYVFSGATGVLVRTS